LNHVKQVKITSLLLFTVSGVKVNPLNRGQADFSGRNYEVFKIDVMSSFAAFESVLHPEPVFSGY
jgi:DNA invertase Pin-like site-specific DNA recombinase